jgi:hypothetical protein
LLGSVLGYHGNSCCSVLCMIHAMAQTIFKYGFVCERVCMRVWGGGGCLWGMNGNRRNSWAFCM